MKRLLLVRHAPTSATRASAFPADESLDERSREDAARALADTLPRSAELLASPARRCLETAHAAHLHPREHEALRECDFGSWAGATLADVHGRDPAAAGAWIEDPDCKPHGGESLREFSRRVAGFLDTTAGTDGTTVAITHAGVVKAAVVHALCAPLASFWRIDASPLSVTELHAHDGRWTLARLNHRLGP